MAMMMPKGGNSLRRPTADINVTPLVDVMLVLLIIFMVTAPMLASGIKVNLPQAKQIQPLDPKAPVIITVGKDGSLTLGPDTVEKDRLVDVITAKLGSDLTQVIHLRGDKEASYGDVVSILDLLASNGLTHVAIVADPHAKKAEPAKPGPDQKSGSEAIVNSAVNAAASHAPSDSGQDKGSVVANPITAAPSPSVAAPTPQPVPAAQDVRP